MLCYATPYTNSFPKLTPLQGLDFEFEIRTVNVIGSEQSVEQIANADKRKGDGLDCIFVKSNQNYFNDIHFNGRTAAEVIIRSQMRQAIGRAELDGIVRSEGTARRPSQQVRSAERDGISRGEKTC